MLYCFTFPIPDYYEEDVFEKKVYFEKDSCPTHNEVVTALEMLDSEERENVKLYEQICAHEYAACLKAITEIHGGKQLPYIAGSCVYTNVHCDTDFGADSITVELVHPIKLD